MYDMTSDSLVQLLGSERVWMAFRASVVGVLAL